MGKKGNWFSVLKKALSPSKKSKSKKWAEKEKLPDQVVSSSEETVVLSVCAPPPPPLPPPPLPPSRDDAKLAEAKDEQIKHGSSVAAEAVVAAAQAAAEVVHLTNVARYSGKSKEEIAAIKIQTTFRGYLARRALHALRRLVRLKSLIQGQSVKRQTATTLQAMQTLARMQSQIRARRIRMSEENQALQRQLQQKREKEFEKLGASIGEQWDDSAQSKEQIEANLLHKQEAALRREKALAYAFSHQRAWKNATKPATETFMDPNNPQWDWSWLERWMAARPWESRSTVDNSDRASVKSAASHAASLGETTRAYSRRNLNNNKPSPGGQKSSRPPNRQSPSTPLSKALSTSSVTGKVKLRSTKGSTWGGNDDSRSLLSIQSAHYRRHSIAGSSSMRNDESLGSLSSVPSYMAATHSAKGRSNSSSPLGLDRNGTLGKASVASAKKRLSFSASPAGSRRHSGPPKFDARVFKDIEVQVEEKVSNGENDR